MLSTKDGIMSKKILTIILTALMFLSCALLGISSVFRVEEVSVVANLLTEQAKAETQDFKEKLSSLYVEENIFSVKQTQMDALLSKYPYLHITNFKKEYPNKIVVTVSEDAEVYAVETENEEYYILSGEGVLLETRTSKFNRWDGFENVLLKGLTLQNANGVVTGDSCWSSLFSICKTMDERLGGIRSNVLSVEVLSRTPETFYLLRMREGVNIYIRNPLELTEQKANEAIDKYLSLSDEERMTGRLILFDVDGKVFAQYALEDEFQS